MGEGEERESRARSRFLGCLVELGLEEEEGEVNWGEDTLGTADFTLRWLGLGGGGERRGEEVGGG